MFNKGYTHLKLNVIDAAFACQGCVFHFCPVDLENALFRLVCDELTHKMDPSIVLVVSPLKEKTCWTSLCIKPGDSNKFKF